MLFSGNGIQISQVNRNQATGFSNEASVFKKDGQTTINVGKGNDKITIDRYAGGSANVTINDETTDLSPEEADDLVIEGGSDNDNIEINGEGAPGQKLTFKGEAGAFSESGEQQPEAGYGGAKCQSTSN